MNTANIQCLTVEIAPSQVIEVDCEVRAIPAGDLAALENVRQQTGQYAADALRSSQLAQLDAEAASGSSQTANEHRLKAEASAARALTSSIDAKEDADLATTAAGLSEEILTEVTTMHADVEEAWGSIDHATLVSISADLVRTQAMIVSFHGFK